MSKYIIVVQNNEYRCICNRRYRTLKDLNKGVKTMGRTDWISIGGWTSNMNSGDGIDGFLLCDGEFVIVEEVRGTLVCRGDRENFRQVVAKAIEEIPESEL